MAADQRPLPLHLLGRAGGAVALHTEYLVQIGVFGELVLDHGWPISRLAFEAGEFDILGFAAGGRVVLAVEAKARPRPPASDSLASLLDSFRARASDPVVEIPSNHARKCTALAEYCSQGDVTLLLVASGARWWYRVQTDNGTLRLTDL